MLVLVLVPALVLVRVLVLELVLVLVLVRLLIRLLLLLLLLVLVLTECLINVEYNFWKIRRPLLAKGHQAVWHHFNHSILYNLLINLSTHPYDPQSYVLVSGFPHTPQTPKTGARTLGRPYCLTF
jgi:hypothetical protein